MKKFIIPLASFIFLMASCEAEYECNCIDEAGNVTQETEMGADADDACATAGAGDETLSCSPA